MTIEKFPYPISYKNRSLYFDGKSLSSIAKNKKTPFYLYSEKTLHDALNTFELAAITSNLNNPLICFALKANPNIQLLKSLAKKGAGADIVSGGELLRAIKAGIDPMKIVFSGVGKTQEEIDLALMASEDGIYSFNVESAEELDMIQQRSRKLKKIARIAFRFNPQVHAKTHKHISTGFKTHKFGIVRSELIRVFKKIKNYPNIKIVGLSMHIGSQLTCLKATKKALKAMSSLALELKHCFEFLDVGGGLGVHYKRDENTPVCEPNIYMDMIAQVLSREYYSKSKFNPRVVFEPGRYIVAESGVLITRVIRTKISEECHFTIVDGGMNDFIRTSLYDAYHQVIPVKTCTGKKVRSDIVGPICETADRFASGVLTHPPKVGDLFCVCDTGAYGFSMASHYNLREKPKEYILKLDGTIIS